MVKKVFLLFLSTWAGSLWAQFESFSITAPYLENITNSAPVGNETLLFNVDIIPDTLKDTLGNPIGLDSVVSAWIKYSTDNQATWESLPQRKMNELFYEETWERDKLLPPSGTIIYYSVAVDRDSHNFATESPLNGNNTWPPTTNLLTHTGEEPDNDCQIPGRANLELRDFFVGYSLDYIYIRLINNSTSWPYNAGLLGPWFIYGTAIINPRPFMRDTDYVYLAVRASINIPGVIQLDPGLYRLHVDDPLGTLTRIGNIDQQTFGGQLDIRFRLGDLINDPQFETYEGFIAIAGATAQVTLSGEFTLADGTQPTRFYPNTHSFLIGTNDRPVLLNASVSPRIGEPSDSFNFSVIYKDTNNHLPVLRHLNIDDNQYRIGSPDHYYLDGSLFRRSHTGFSPGWHYFHFEFSDGQETLRTQLDSFFVTGVGLAEGKKSSPFLTYSSGKIFLTGLEGKLRLELFSATGSLLGKDEVRSYGRPIELELPRLANGLYFLRIYRVAKGIREIGERKIVLLN